MRLARESLPLRSMNFWKNPTNSISYTDGVTMLPTFMPVATQAAIKGLTSQQVEALGINLILNNTYHLNLRPGMKILKEVGGAHKFQGWRHNLLTVRHHVVRLACRVCSLGPQDSGGFQLVSLSKFTKITEEGALFSSPFDGEPTMLTVRTQYIAIFIDLPIGFLAARREYVNTAHYRG